MPRETEEYFSPQYVNVAESEEGEGIEVPAEADSKLLLSTLQGNFPEAIGLRYRGPTGSWRAIRLADGFLDPPPEGWRDNMYMVVKGKPAEKTAVTVTDGEKGKLLVDDGDIQIRSKPGEKDVPKREAFTDDIILLGLSYDATEDDIRSFFGKYGKVSNVEVKRHYITKQPKGIGFVSFEDKSVIEQALGTHDILNKTTSVQKNEKRFKPCRLFVGRLPSETNEEELRSIFEGFGEIENILIPREFHGFVFVTYKDTACAKDVLKKEIIFKGRTLKVDIAAPKPGEDQDGPPPFSSRRPFSSRPPPFSSRSPPRRRSRSPRGRPVNYDAGYQPRDAELVNLLNTMIHNPNHGRGYRDPLPPPPRSYRDASPPRFSRDSRRREPYPPPRDFFNSVETIPRRRR